MRKCQNSYCATTCVLSEGPEDSIVSNSRNRTLAREARRRSTAASLHQYFLLMFGGLSIHKLCSVKYPFNVSLNKRFTACLPALGSVHDRLTPGPIFASKATYIVDVFHHSPALHPPRHVFASVSLRNSPPGRFCILHFLPGTLECSPAGSW